MAYVTLTFDDLKMTEAQRLIALAETFEERPRLRDFPPAAAAATPVPSGEPPTQAHQTGQPVPGPAPARPPQPRKVKAEKPIAAPSVSPSPIGGPVMLPLTLDELKRRAMLFMDDPTCGGELFAKRLAEFAKVDGSPVKRISDLPVEMYDTFLHRLVPELRMSQTATSGGSLLD